MLCYEKRWIQLLMQSNSNSLILNKILIWREVTKSLSGLIARPSAFVMRMSWLLAFIMRLHLSNPVNLHKRKQNCRDNFRVIKYCLFVNLISPFIWSWAHCKCLYSRPSRCKREGTGNKEKNTASCIRHRSLLQEKIRSLRTQLRPSEFATWMCWAHCIYW